MDTPQLKKLAELARIELTAGEETKLSESLEAILSYIDRIKGMEVKDDLEDRPELSNIFRQDQKPHPSGIFSKRLLAEIPETKDNWVKVKKVL